MKTVSNSLSSQLKLIDFFSVSGCHSQDGHGTGKTGNLDVNFSRQGKHREFGYNTGKKIENIGKKFELV